MHRILFIASSPSGEQWLFTRFANDMAQAHSREGNGAVTAQDLSTAPLPHIGPAHVYGRVAPAETRMHE